MGTLLSPSSSSMKDMSPSGWSNFDFSLIHPSHGLLFDTPPPTLSMAEKLLASIDMDDSAPEECDPQGDSSMEYQSDHLDKMGHSAPSSSSSSPSSASSTSETSAGILTPSSSFSLSYRDPSNYFPLPQQHSHSQDPSKPIVHSPPVQLERISSCYFSPPDVESLQAVAPLDITLQNQLSSFPLPSNTPLASPPIFAQSSPHFVSSTAFAESPIASSSSSLMVRSWSAPIHTQAEYDALKSCWNAQSTSPPSPTKKRPVMNRPVTCPSRPSFSRSTSHSATSGTIQLPLRRTRPPNASDDSLRSTLSTYATPSMPYSSRNHFLSPSGGNNPFKRSRLSNVPEERSCSPSCFATSAASVCSCTSPCSHSSFPSEQQEGMDKALISSLTPPKSPTRPGLNRFYTSPELFAGSS